MIYTFYSYKGGVGRSMALANVAKWFYLHGLRVVIVDWDLEAPGLENFFFDSEDSAGREELRRIQDRPGLIDLLIRYQRRFPALPVPSWPKVLARVLEQLLPAALPPPLAQVNLSLLLKALEQNLPATLRPLFDQADTRTVLRLMGESLPAILFGPSGEKKSGEVLKMLEDRLPPTLRLPFEQADITTLFRAMEESLRVAPLSNAAAASDLSRSGEPAAADLLKMLEGSVPAIAVSFDSAYKRPLLNLLQESLPETLPLSTADTVDETTREALNTVQIFEALDDLLPPRFPFILKQSYAEALLGMIEENLPAFSTMLYPIYHDPSSAVEVSTRSDDTAHEERPPGLWLLSAGWRFGERFSAYAQDVQGFNWTDFYNAYEGEAYFEWMRNQLNRFADIVLIDSRTGVTEMGGVCTRQLADVVVSFVAPNGQNLNGVATMVTSFRRQEILQARRKWEDVSSAVHSSLEVVVVPTRIETSEVDERNKFEKRFRDQLDKPPDAFLKINASFWDLKIPYIPKYAYNEKLVIGATDRSEELEDAYKDLCAHLVMLLPPKNIVRRRFTKELRETFPSMVPGLILVAYAGDAHDAAQELQSRLEEEGIAVWDDAVEIEDSRGEPRQIGSILEQCESVVIVMSPSMNPDTILRQWRNSRRQGKCVYLAGRNPAEAQALLSTRRLPKSAETFDLSSDWDKLLRKFQNPCRASRLPFMAPAAPERFVGREAELRKLKDILLNESPQRRRTSIDVAICGMGGIGKSALALAFCHDEEVLRYFDGGILWATLGGNAAILPELAKLYAALTGERGSFASSDEAVIAVAERTHGQRCLMVLDDVWEKKDLRPFARAGEYCSLLITTRDQGLALESADEIVAANDIETAAAIEILTARLKTSFDGSASQSQLATLVHRLGSSPLALELAGAELRKRVELGDRLSNAVEHLNQALSVQGVSAFDTRDTEDRSRSVAVSIALSLDRLSEEERSRYVLLAGFDEGEIPVEKISQTWGLDSFRTEHLIQRLGSLSLLRFDPERKSVTLNRLLRSYLQQRLPASPASFKQEITVERGETANSRLARNILRGQSGGTPRELFDLAMQLKAGMDFGLARRLLNRIRQDARLNEDKLLRLKTIQQLSLCTRKDPDLPVDERLDVAFEILKETGEDLNVTQDPETLGLAGAIYKNKWAVDNQKQQLERSLAYYLRGYRAGIATDYGYNGINAAFVLDLIADQEAFEARRAGTVSTSAAARRSEAELIRREIAGTLPEMARQPGKEFLPKEWWFTVTVAEAFFGLRRYDEALYWLKEAAAIPAVADWEYETTARQLASIAHLQDESSNAAGDMKESKAWDVLRVFLMNDADAVRSAFLGKVGLALSGGGFRASLFHIGVLAKLAELDVLRSVEVLSCVSGGSIIGAHYYLEVRELLQTKRDSDITRQDYIEIVQRIEREFLAGVQRNVRTRVAADIITNLKMIFRPNYSRTERVGELYESEIFSRTTRSSEPLYLNDLMIRPFDSPAGFSPRLHNWRRSAKVPVLILNATTLNTGHNWQFTTSWMGEPPTGINTEIDGNDRLRRMYYSQAPEPYGRIRLGYAVAASACVPGIFEPLTLASLYPERIVRLVDGGVHDNQGIGGLLGEDCSVLLVSDASGQMGTLNNPSPGFLGVPLRSNSILQARVREAEYRELEARRRSWLVRGLMFIHLKKDLEVDPVDWIGCDDPYDPADETHTVRRRGIMTAYGVRKDVQQSLAAIRTDLDSFSDSEAYTLMASGYRMTGHEFAECIRGFPNPPEDKPQWRFFSVEKAMDRAKGFDDAHHHLMRSLNAGSAMAFKVFKLAPALRPVVGISAAIVVSLLVWLFMASTFLQAVWSGLVENAIRGAGYISSSGQWLAGSIATPLGAAAATVLAIALPVLGSAALRVIRRYKPLSHIAIGLVMITLGWIAARIHLRLFDSLYLRLGRVDGQTERTR